MSQQYEDIIIDISHEAVDRAFQYEVPDSLRDAIEIGMTVVIPFGTGNKLRKGFVVGFCDTPKYDPAKIKQIDSIETDTILIESRLIELAAFIKKTYGSTMINALKVVLPVKDKIKAQEYKEIALRMPKAEALTYLQECERKHYKAKARLLQELIEYGVLPYQLAVKNLGITATTFSGLVRDGVITITKEIVYRNYQVTKAGEQKEIQLNEEQKAAVECFSSQYHKHIHQTYLLHGITGSGKTQVYMEMIKQVIQDKKQAIVLIPEISLTFQTMMRFYETFGDRVAIMHSKLSKGERYDQYLRAKNGEVDIVIGPRSALFAPLPRLGLIVIDEEHENSYKSEMPPKYHAREVAIERGRLEHASVILGSATPSIESYTKARLGEYQLLRLSKRAVEEAALPITEIVDLRAELANGNKSMFSERLRALMEDRLQKKEQIMLFLNRRGYAGFVSCRSCGKVIQCPHCDVSLTKHRDGQLVCHYCGHRTRQPKECPSCGSKMIAAFGTGTQKVEEAVQREFPNARVLRMDMDTTRRKDGHEQLLQQFANKEADILVGTQMIVKGHDFAGVTLMGIIAADMSLFDSDYRSGERTFDLITQAAGRAGRGQLSGNVVIQTYQPEHYAIVTAANQDYEAFYEQEIAYRQMLKYPPVYQMMVIIIISRSVKIADFHSEELARRIKRQYTEGSGYTVIGPGPATCSKVNDLYRCVIYIKHLEHEKLCSLVEEVEGWLEQEEEDYIVQFDVNPMNMY